MRGDIVLYKDPTKLSEKAITWTTHGPFYHVEIVYDDTHTIGAHPEGIRYATYPNGKSFVVQSLPSNVSAAAGLRWAQQQIGKRYGWLDIAYQAVKFLAPNNPFQLTQKDHWDCSDFVTRYLQECGMQLSDEFSDPYQNTPNDIARIFGLIPPRKAAA